MTLKECRQNIGNRVAHTKHGAGWIIKVTADKALVKFRPREPSEPVDPAELELEPDQEVAHG